MFLMVPVTRLWYSNQNLASLKFPKIVKIKFRTLTKNYTGLEFFVKIAYYSYEKESMLL